ncbi:MAG: hypothetical protein DMF24_09740 [Verrucomicrobia bacterium]|nr:MAG: hypothetical protein DMF24_09740 [Verrucomicrobiota bacterium]
MALPKVATLIADRLNSAGIKWMATGSIAAMSYGEYRVTNDVDVVLVLSERDIEKLVAAFPLAEFYCPPEDVIRTEAAREEHGHFNLIHHETGFKADVYIAGKDALTSWALRQRQPVRLEESVIWLAPPEYVIIGKLEFYREGGSEKHLRDIRGMLAVTDVDRALLEKEIAQRGLADVWRKLI